MRIDVFSDTVCPWCFIGKRHLQQALSETGMTDADVHWHAFQLNPDMPAGGRDRKTYLLEKFGPDAEQRIHARLQEAGRAAGIEFQFDRISRSPNTLDSHRLIRLAASRGRQDAAVEALFRSYFVEGQDIGDRQVLAAIASQLDLGNDVSAWLDSPAEINTVRSEDSSARRLGITGVPFFIFEQRHALSGAQPVNVFVRALQTVKNESIAS
ncbi:MAG TPA: DsbA family oxidoreductase [Gammaproteobacteria bacterium]